MQQAKWKAYAFGMRLLRIRAQALPLLQRIRWKAKIECSLQNGADAEGNSNENEVQEKLLRTWVEFVLCLSP